jgi:hypothetical protein
VGAGPELVQLMVAVIAVPTEEPYRSTFGKTLVIVTVGVDLVWVMLKLLVWVLLAEL